MEARARRRPCPLKASAPLEEKGRKAPRPAPQGEGPGRSPRNSAPVHQPVATYRVRNPSGLPERAGGVSDRMRQLRRRSPRWSPRPSRRSPERLGRDRPPVTPSVAPPPRQGAFGEARPIPALRPEGRPMHYPLPARTAHPGTTLAYRKPALLRSAVLPRLPRWRLTF